LYVDKKAVYQVGNKELKKTVLLGLPGPTRWGPISECRNVGNYQPMLLDTDPAHVVF